MQWTNLVPHAHLEDRAVLFGPFGGEGGMLVAKLEEIAEQRHSGDFRKALILGISVRFR